jgi:hypothetical protein
MDCFAALAMTLKELARKRTVIVRARTIGRDRVAAR